MSLTLIPIPAQKFSSWLKRSTSEYVADLITAGTSPAKAQDNAERTMAGSFPDSLPTDSNAVFILDHDDFGDVGYLWIGRDTSEDPAYWWLWDIMVDPEYQGKGFGREAMELAEAYALAQDAKTLGLSVFGFNHAARGLYESLGFETTGVKMRKTL